MSGPAKCAGHRAGVTTATEFRKTSPIACSFDQELGVCVGWAAFSKRNGQDYVDAHGDHFPDVELFKAVDALNRIPVADRAINVEHAGPARGEIVSAFALTEDFCKASSPKIDTGGTYGILVTFKPDADLLKSIKAGEAVCLSIEGRAHDVETIAKSALVRRTSVEDGTGVPIEATAHKRTMRKVELTALAVVKAGAHEGAAVAVIKSAGNEIAIWRAAKVAKRKPAMTTAVNGHQHSIYDAEELSGGTSYETAPGAPYGHSHPFIRHDDGSISIGAVDGHTHDLATTEDSTMADDLNKTLTADLAKARKTLADVLALPPAELAYAKRLDEAGVTAFVAKSADERAKLAAPVYVAKSGRAYFAGEEGMVELAKALDEQTAELAKAKNAARLTEFAKAGADKWGHLIGGSIAHTAIAKALATADLTAEERQAAESALVAASATVAKLKTPIGVEGGDEADPFEAYQKKLAEFAKAAGKSPDEASPEFLSSPTGRAAYQDYIDASRGAVNSGRPR